MQYVDLSSKYFGPFWWTHRRTDPQRDASQNSTRQLVVTGGGAGNQCVSIELNMGQFS